MLRLLVLLCVAGLGLLLTSCGSAAGPAAERSSGDEPELADQLAAIDDADQRFRSAVGSSYTLVFEFVGSVSAGQGPIEVEVADGKVVDASFPDDLLASMLPGIPLLTVEDLFARARTVLADGGRVEITFNESYGYPTVVSFDPIPNAIDDEFSVEVSSVEPVDDTLDGGDGY